MTELILKYILTDIHFHQTTIFRQIRTVTTITHGYCEYYNIMSSNLNSVTLIFQHFLVQEIAHQKVECCGYTMVKILTGLISSVVSAILTGKEQFTLQQML